MGEYSNLCKTLDWGIRALRENHLNHTTGRHCSMCNCGLRNTETTLVSNIQLCSVSSLPKAACFASERDLAPYVINPEENRAMAQWHGWKVLPSSSCHRCHRWNFLSAIYWTLFTVLRLDIGTKMVVCASRICPQFSLIKNYFYRTQVNLGSDLWVRMSQTNKQTNKQTDVCKT